MIGDFPDDYVKGVMRQLDLFAEPAPSIRDVYWSEIWSAAHVPTTAAVRASDMGKNLTCSDD